MKYVPYSLHINNKFWLFCRCCSKTQFKKRSKNAGDTATTSQDDVCPLLYE